MDDTRLFQRLPDETFWVAMREPSHFLQFAEIQHPLDDVLGVLLGIDRLGVHVPEERATEFHDGRALGHKETGVFNSNIVPQTHSKLNQKILYALTGGS